MTLPTIAKALGGVVTGGQVLAPGPGHSAQDRSLSVRIGETGKPIVFSHAGDDKRRCLEYVETRLGITWQPNTPLSASAGKTNGSKPTNGPNLSPSIIGRPWPCKSGRKASTRAGRWSKPTSLPAVWSCRISWR